MDYVVDVNYTSGCCLPEGFILACGMNYRIDAFWVIWVAIAAAVNSLGEFLFCAKKLKWSWKPTWTVNGVTL